MKNHLISFFFPFFFCFQIYSFGLWDIPSVQWTWTGYKLFCICNLTNYFVSGKKHEHKNAVFSRLGCMRAMMCTFIIFSSHDSDRLLVISCGLLVQPLSSVNGFMIFIVASFMICIAVNKEPFSANWRLWHLIQAVFSPQYLSSLLTEPCLLSDHNSTAGIAKMSRKGLMEQDLSKLDVKTLHPLSPEVISRQATINIGDFTLFAF